MHGEIELSGVVVEAVHGAGLYLKLLSSCCKTTECLSFLSGGIAHVEVQPLGWSQQCYLPFSLPWTFGNASSKNT